MSSRCHSSTKHTRQKLAALYFAWRNRDLVLLEMIGLGNHPPAPGQFQSGQIVDEDHVIDAEAAEARCIEWMNWLASNVHAMSYGQIWRPLRFTNDESVLPALRSRDKENVSDPYAYIESLLSDGRQWAVPEGYSVVDPYLLYSITGANASTSTCASSTRLGRN